MSCCAVLRPGLTVCLSAYRLQVLQEAADSVLTPRWQTQTQVQTGVSQRQPPFSSSLQFQAAHDADFCQPSHVDSHQNQPLLNSSLKSSADADIAEQLRPDSVDADHAADVEFALHYMRAHEMSSSRIVSDSDDRAANTDNHRAATYSDADDCRTGSLAPDGADAAEQPGSASAHRNNMAVLSFSSSSNNSSIDDMCAVQAGSQQQLLPAPAQPLAMPVNSKDKVPEDSSGSNRHVAYAGQSSSLQESWSASAQMPAMPANSSKVAGAHSSQPRFEAVAEGRVLRPHNTADVAFGNHAAFMVGEKHVERAVGLVEPASHAPSVPSLDIMIKTGNVVR